MAEADFKFINYYRCRHEDTPYEVSEDEAEEWEDVWSCMCNDRCPICRHETEPFESDDL